MFSLSDLPVDLGTYIATFLTFEEWQIILRTMMIVPLALPRLCLPFPNDRLWVQNEWIRFGRQNRYHYDIRLPKDPLLLDAFVPLCIHDYQIKSNSIVIRIIFSSSSLIEPYRRIIEDPYADSRDPYLYATCRFYSWMEWKQACILSCYAQEYAFPRLQHQDLTPDTQPKTHRWLLGYGRPMDIIIPIGETVEVDVMDDDGLWWWSVIQWLPDRKRVHVHFYGWDSRWDLALPFPHPRIQHLHTFSHVWNYHDVTIWCHWKLHQEVEVRMDEKWYCAKIIRVFYHAQVVRIRLQTPLPGYTRQDLYVFDRDLPWDSQDLCPAGYHCPWSVTAECAYFRHDAKCTSAYKTLIRPLPLPNTFGHASSFGDASSLGDDDTPIVYMDIRKHPKKKNMILVCCTIGGASGKKKIKS